MGCAADLLLKGRSPAAAWPGRSCLRHSPGERPEGETGKKKAAKDRYRHAEVRKLQSSNGRHGNEAEAVGGPPRQRGTARRGAAAGDRAAPAGRGGAAAETELGSAGVVAISWDVGGATGKRAGLGGGGQAGSLPEGRGARVVEWEDGGAET